VVVVQVAFAVAVIGVWSANDLQVCPLEAPAADETLLLLQRGAGAEIDIEYARGEKNIHRGVWKRIEHVHLEGACEVGQPQAKGKDNEIATALHSANSSAEIQLDYWNGKN
jgi:hypothetical protein